MRRHTHGNAITSRNEAWNQATPGGGQELGMFPDQPICRVSESMLRHSHRPRADPRSWPRLDAEEHRPGGRQRRPPTAEGMATQKVSEQS